MPIPQSTGMRRESILIHRISARKLDLQLSTFSAAIKASCGMSTLPNCRSSSCFLLLLQKFPFAVMSPP